MRSTVVVTAICLPVVAWAQVDPDQLGATESSAAPKAGSSTSTPQESESSARFEGLEEIVVTAQKRSERLQDVPMSLTVLGGDQLARSQSFRLQDYVGNVPGLNLIDVNGLGNQLVIRGLSSGAVTINAGVATYIDETPFTPVGPFAGSYISQPNLDTFDLQRIEVLRGPQGTLYGANALAGLMKYVTNAPDPSGFASRVDVGVSSVSNGGTGFDVHGMVNVPLADDTALRLVGYENQYPGYTDDSLRGLNNTNEARFTGGRASLLYAPTPDLSIRLTASYQKRKWDDFGDVDVSPGTLQPIHGDLTHQDLINDSGETTIELYNATVNWDVGFAKLVSATSYYSLHTHSVYEFSTLNAVASAVLGPPYEGMALDFDTPVKTLTQELRLSSSGGTALDWQLGGYFANASGSQRNSFLPINTVTGEVEFAYPVVLGNFHLPTHYREYAGFANLDYHLTPSLDLSVGGRYSHNDQEFNAAGAGVLAGPPTEKAESSEDAYTYSAGLRWRVTPQQMLYARVASGFVPGGPNAKFAGSNLPGTYDSSTTVNYEVGMKSDWLDRRLSTEVAVFYVDWRDIQLQTTVDGLSGATNGGGAVSKGVELNLSYAPVMGLTLNLNGSYTDAYLTEATLPSVGGASGDRLPGVPSWQTSASASYERPLVGDLVGFMGINWRFSDHRFSDFVAGSPRQNLSSYHITDLRAGVETQRWSVAAYVKNVANETAIIYVQPETFAGGNGPQTATMYTPRTIGISVSANFE